jgi:hypothetical protein
MTTKKRTTKKAKFTVVTPFNYHEQPRAERDKDMGISATQPDQTMPLRQILERYSRGLPITGQVGEPEYYGEEIQGIDARSLDLTERQAIIDAGIQAQKQITIDRQIKEQEEEKEKEKEVEKQTEENEE